MATALQERCTNHALREAVARCPECGRFYCRECVTEHEDRVLCAACLSKLAAVGGGGRARFATLARVTCCVLGIMTSWLFFHWMGRMLLAMPSSFHEGTLWSPTSSEDSE